MHFLDKVYSSLPVFIQNLSVSAYGLYWNWARFGGKSQEFVKAYQLRDKFSPNQWERFQSESLRKLLKHSAEQVPYYRDTWTEYEKVEAIKGNLATLPFLEKSTARNDPAGLTSLGPRPYPLFKFHTSGTTGTPILCTYTLSELRRSMAIREARSARWAGVSFSLPRGTISGRMVVPDPNSKGPFHRYNASEKQAYFSAFHLRPDTAACYVEAMKRHNLVWLTGYAVSYFLLAKFVLQQNIQVGPLRAMITTSEKLTAEMRAVMEQAYQCKIYEEYSTVENALFASECEHGNLHVSPDGGIVEILRPDGTPCAPGEIGEVVTTSFLRTYQPYIRYRLGDLAAWDDQPCPCGRHMPVIKEVVGRIEDVVTGPDGRQLVRFHGIFVDQPHVLEGQIVQESLDTFTVKVVPTEGFSETDVMDIQKRMHQRLGESVFIQVEKVAAIPRNSAGKYKSVVSQIKQT